MKTASSTSLLALALTLLAAPVLEARYLTGSRHVSLGYSTVLVDGITGEDANGYSIGYTHPLSDELSVAIGLGKADVDYTATRVVDGDEGPELQEVSLSEEAQGLSVRVIWINTEVKNYRAYSSIGASWTDYELRWDVERDSDDVISVNAEMGFEVEVCSRATVTGYLEGYYWTNGLELFGEEGDWEHGLWLGTRVFTSLSENLGLIGDVAISDDGDIGIWIGTAVSF